MSSPHEKPPEEAANKEKDDVGRPQRNPRGENVLFCQEGSHHVKRVINTDSEDDAKCKADQSVRLPAQHSQWDT